MNYLKRIKGKFEDLSLKNKLLAMICSNVLLILLIALIGLKISSHAYNEQLYKAISGNLSFSSQTIASNLNSIETLSSVTISASVIQDALNRIDSIDDTIVWSNANREISQVINNYQQAYKKDGVLAIALYNRRFKNATNFVVANNADQDLVNGALKKAREREGAITWTIDHEHNLYILGRSVRKANNLELNHLGDLLVFVDMDRIVSEANRAVTTYDDTSYILFDRDQLIYASSGIDRETACLLKEQTGQPYSIVRSHGHSYFAVKNTIPYYGWTYINLVPYDQIASSTTMAYRLILGMLIIGLLIAIAYSRRLTRYILKDFDLLIQKMEFFSSTELEMPKVQVDYSQRTDEISRLHQHFDTMAGRIQYLVHNNYVNQILSRDAKLKALEAQINPHFLYNTLETINWRAKALKDQQISSMVESLGTLLRATLSSKNPLVTLDYEISLARSYMTIQKIRFEERLVFQTDCGRELGGALILPLTIQPLLENAIRYGMEEMMETCEISISARRKEIPESGEYVLIVEVSNEGSVFEEGLLEKLLDGTRNAHGFGIGLVNIHQRIQMLFGEGYGLSFQNRDETAVAVITIPYRTEEKDYAEINYCG